MGITREKISTIKERSFVSHCIMSDAYLKQMSDVGKPELLQTPYAQTVFRWCIDYYREYEKAPAKDIQELYLIHRTSMEDDQVDLIAEFLKSLSDSYQAPDNLEYHISQGLTFLSIRQATRVKDQLIEAIDKGDLVAIEKTLASYKTAKRVQSTAIDAINNDDEIIAAFSEEKNKLFRFFGAIGDVCGDFLRGDFVAFQAFAKGRKSWALLYSANAALEAGLKTLYISMEMPKGQVLRRLWGGLTGTPKQDKEVSIPFFYKDHDDDAEWRVDYEKQVRKGFKPTKEILDNWRAERRKYYRTGELRIESIPSRSMTINELLAYVENLEYYHNYLPDVIVLDYADLVSSREKDYRNKLDDIWSNLRKFAMQKNILIVTASQSGRGAATGDSTAENIAEDIRKVAHCTKLFALNSTPAERARNLMRIASIADREDAPSFEQVLILQQLDLGMFCLDSRFMGEVHLEKEEGGKK